MQYLQDLQHYEDRYDLWTIEQCLRQIEMLRKVSKEMQGAKELKHLSLEEKNNQLGMIGGRIIMNIKIRRYNEKEATIKQWIEKDQQKQDLQDKTPPPKNIRCSKCRDAMHDTIHHLHSDVGEKDRVLFFFQCDKCNLRKAVFENGEEWVRKPDLCKQCGAELKHSFETKGKYEIWEEHCTECNYKKTEKTDLEKEKLERKEKADHEKNLLAKYRQEYCLGKEEAERLINSLEELAFADEVFRYELQKYDSPEYEKTHNLRKLTAIEVDELLSKALESNRFGRLRMKEPQFSQFVDIEFTTQNTDKARNEKESTLELKKLIKNTLAPTNWRLNSGHIVYRLGFLTGSLRGYERDDDILKTLVKDEPKPRIELDPEKLNRFGNSNAVNLARLMAEIEGKQISRRKRFEKEPEGFILENHGNSYYTCKLCYRSHKGNEMWWLPDAILCLDCHRNLREGVYPAEILTNDKIWFSSWDVEQEFGMHNATVRKHVRNGDLVPRELKDSNGKTYYTIFLAEDNVNFFKTHPRKGERKQRWHFVDGNGEIIWL